MDIHGLLILQTDTYLRKAGRPETGDREDTETFVFDPFNVMVERTFRKDGPDQLVLHIKQSNPFARGDDWASFTVEKGAIAPDRPIHGDEPFTSPELNRTLLIFKLLVGRVRSSKTKQSHATTA